MSERIHDNWLQSYMVHMRNSEAPEIFHFWTGVSAIAGAMRRRCWIDQRIFQWTPNFYIIFVAPPGVATKSTTVDAGMRLLGEVPGIHFGPDSMSWQAMLDALKDAHEMAVPPVGDGWLPMSCITCAISELGTFLDPSDDKMMSMFVDLWDGKIKNWKRRIRMEGEIQIENPWINIIGCTTPSWLQQNFPEHMIGGGLTSRTIFIYADEKRQLVPYPSLCITGKDFEEEEQELIHDLQLIAEMIGEFEIESEALQWGIEWYEEHWKQRPEHMASERYGGYLARKQTHMHKLAMILSASETNGKLITLDHLQTSLRMVNALEHDMKKVFDSIGVSPAAAATRELLQYVFTYDSISRQELWRMCMHNMDPKVFKEAISAAIDANYVGQRADGSGGFELYAKRKQLEQKASAKVHRQ